jgi:hypothetical protein
MVYLAAFYSHLNIFSYKILFRLFVIALHRLSVALKPATMRDD